MKRVVLWVFAFILLVANSKAEASSAKGDYFLTPFVGGISFQGHEDLTTGSIFGLGLGLALTPQWGIEGKIGTLSTKQKSDAKDLNATLFDLSALYHFKPLNRWNPFMRAGAGTMNIGLRGSHLMLNYGLGVQYILLEERVSIRPEIRHLFEINSDPLPFNNFEYTIGVTFRAPKILPPPPPPDSDHDGVTDLKDICPNTPLGDKVEENGCSLDHDKDGVSDILDICPGTPAGISVDGNGCPLDTDSDGVPDTLDKCPNTPVGISIDRHGCPLDTDSDSVPDTLDKCLSTPIGISVDGNGCPLDTDLDGVPDTMDKCANTKAGDSIDTNGCSVAIDADLDGVPDVVDLCPGTPAGSEVNTLGCSKEREDELVEQDTDQDGVLDSYDRCPGSPLGALVDSLGCPSTLKEKEKIALKIQFDPNQSVVNPQYDGAIKSLAELMNSRPGVYVQIQGYTDNFGLKKTNRDISRLRAEVVMQYLIDRFGISASRITAKGYGSSNPIADNATSAGREQNMRIMAVILEVF